MTEVVTSGGGNISFEENKKLSAGNIELEATGKIR
jgi:hypothetical protein